MGGGRARVLHLTDLHFQVAPSLGDLFGKRAVGAFNLYARGRAKRFSLEAQRRTVAAALAHRPLPDLVVVSGDLTAVALESEFRLARDELEELLDRQPSLVVPGNHDVYVHGEGDLLFRRYFGRWAGPRVEAASGALVALGLDPCRPNLLLATGRYPERQLGWLAGELQRQASSAASVLLVTHYPAVAPDGRPYDSRTHGALNNGRLLETLARAPLRPAAVLHGHIHRRYRSRLPPECGGSATENPGAGGLVASAAFGVYELENNAVVSSEYVRTSR